MGEKCPNVCTTRGPGSTVHTAPGQFGRGSAAGFRDQIGRAQERPPLRSHARVRRRLAVGRRHKKTGAKDFSSAPALVSSLGCCARPDGLAPQRIRDQTTDHLRQVARRPRPVVCGALTPLRRSGFGARFSLERTIVKIVARDERHARENTRVDDEEHSGLLVHGQKETSPRWRRRLQSDHGPNVRKNDGTLNLFAGPSRVGFVTDRQQIIAASGAGRLGRRARRYFPSFFSALLIFSRSHASAS